MTDTRTGKPMRVETSTVAPYLRLPYSQVPDVRRLLEAAGIWHELSENIISVNGGPMMATLNFGRRGDAEKIQAALDQRQENRGM